MRCKTYDYWKYIDSVKQNIGQKVRAIKEDCPKNILGKPEDNINCRFFRFQIDEQDLYPYFKGKPSLFLTRARDKKSICIMCGLSTYTSYEETERSMQSVLNARLNKMSSKLPNLNAKILFCDNLAEYGEVYDTSTRGGKHYTFFPCEGYDPNKVWKVYK